MTNSQDENVEPIMNNGELKNIRYIHNSCWNEILKTKNLIIKKFKLLIYIQEQIKTNQQVQLEDNQMKLGFIQKHYQQQKSQRIINMEKENIVRE